MLTFKREGRAPSWQAGRAEPGTQHPPPPQGPFLSLSPGSISLGRVPSVSTEPRLPHSCHGHSAWLAESPSVPPCDPCVPATVPMVLPVPHQLLAHSWRGICAFSSHLGLGDTGTGMLSPGCACGGPQSEARQPLCASPAAAAVEQPISGWQGWWAAEPESVGAAAPPQMAPAPAG